MNGGKAIAVRIMEEITGEPKEICEGYVETTEKRIGIEGLEGNYTSMEVEKLAKKLAEKIRSLPMMEAQIKAGMAIYKSRMN